MSLKEEKQMTEKNNVPQVEVSIKNAKKDFARFNKYVELVKKNLKDKEAKRA